MKTNKRINKFFNRYSLLILTKLIQTFVWVFFIFNILLFLFYIIGNFQSFLDKSQIFIIRTLIISSILMCVMAFSGVIYNSIYIFYTRHKIKHLIKNIFMLFCLVIGIIFIFYCTILLNLSFGIS